MVDSARAGTWRRRIQAPRHPRTRGIDHLAAELPPRSHSSTVRTMAVRVVIAEDHLLVREGLERILESSADVELVGSAVDGEALLESVERARPDVVVTDVRMPP